MLWLDLKEREKVVSTLVRHGSSWRPQALVCLGQWRGALRGIEVTFDQRAADPALRRARFLTKCANIVLGSSRFSREMVAKPYITH